MSSNQQRQSKRIASPPNDVFYRKLFVLIPILTFLVYVRILGQQYLDFDDNWYIYESRYVAGLTSDRLSELFTQPYQGQYSPVPQLYLALLFKLGGGQPFLMKLFALLTHILNSLLVFRLIYKLTNEYRGAFIVSALFALHPVQVESVAWLTAIFKISACFSLVAMLLYLKFLETRKGMYYAGVMLLFVLSFMTKEQAILLPLSLVLIDYVRGRDLLSKQVIIEKLPLLLMSLALGVLTMKIAATGMHISVDNTTLGNKIYSMSLAIGYYVQKLLIPVGLSILYLAPIFTKGLQPEHVVLPVIVLAGLILGLFALRKDRNGLFGMCFWIANLSLSLLFVLVTLRDAFIADRYLYLASVGFFLALYSLISRWVIARPGNKNIVQLVALIYLVALTVATYRRTPVFSNPETLWTDAIKQNPNNFHAYNNRGCFYRTTKDYRKAISDYRNSIDSNPHFHVAHYNLGVAYFETGQMDKALIHSNMAMEKYALTRRQSQSESRYFDAYNSRAAIYVSIDELDKALADLELVLNNEPDRADALYNRSLALYKLREYQKSLRDLERLLKDNPEAAWSLNLAGLCYGQLGETRNAIALFARAIASDPRQGLFWLNRSRAYNQSQNREKALADALQAQKLGVRVDPDYLSSLRK